MGIFNIVSHCKPTDFKSGILGAVQSAESGWPMQILEAT